MGVVEDFRARLRRPRGGRAWPVGKGELVAPDYAYGHDQSQFSPEEYGDYLATSNDIFAVATQRARLLSSVPLRFYRGSGANKVERPESAAARLYRQVNPYWTSERLNRVDELSMSVWGESYWALEYQGGQPAEIWWLKPSRVRPVPHETEYLRRFAYHSVSGEVLMFEPHEIVWQRYPNPLDEFSPLSPLAAARLAADTSAAMMRSNRAMFANGLQAAGIITPPADKVTFSEQQASELERDMTRRLSGADKAHRWAILRYEAKFQQLQLSQRDAEFVAGLGLTFRQVCRAYGMQPALMGDMDNATLANATVFERIEWTRALVPDAALRAGDIREQYLPRFAGRGAPDHCEHDLTAVPALQESATESWTREAQALDRGAITINEWRKGKGMPPVAWGDRPWLPVNKAPVGADGALELPEQPAGKTPPDDEVNPASPAPQVSGEKALDHMAARRLLSQIDWPRALNGARR